MPEWRQHLRSRLAQLRLNPAREAEIIEELSQHLDQRYEELRGGGSRPDSLTRSASARLPVERFFSPTTLNASGALS